MCDLYADLDTSSEALALIELRAQLDAEKKQNESLREKVGRLEGDKERLEAENSILLRNISCLYNTAKSELARRASQLQRLHDAK
jgi:CII-binding regulator of phage lambda lysogenization HflD